MIIKRLAQFILDSYLDSNTSSFSGKVKEKFSYFLRQRLLLYSDPDVKYSYNGKELLIPFSHALPVSKKTNSLYGENLARLAVCIKSFYSDLTMIDIGANVGDTAVIVKNKIDIPILCIEGEDKFYSLLKNNLSGFGDIEFEKSFVGDKNNWSGSYVYSEGTGRIVENRKSPNLKFDSLKDIIKIHSQFEKSKLLKIDTDGFDCRIIRSNIDLLSLIKPVIFFEYDPFLLSELNDDGLSVFNLLLEADYSMVFFYTNTGEYLLSSYLKDEEIIKDMHYYFSGRNIESYSDIVVFHSEDTELAEVFKKKELQFYAFSRNFRI